MPDLAHVCTCGDCSPQAYVDRCRFEDQLATAKREAEEATAENQRLRAELEELRAKVVKWQ